MRRAVRHGLEPEDGAVWEFHGLRLERVAPWPEREHQHGDHRDHEDDGEESPTLETRGELRRRGWVSHFTLGPGQGNHGNAVPQREDISGRRCPVRCGPV